MDDRDPLKNEGFLKNVFGKFFGDISYISKDLFETLFTEGLQLLTGILNNMKDRLMSMNDKIMLRKRSIIETMNDELKNFYLAERSIHRSFVNFIVNILAGLTLTVFSLKKPSISFYLLKTNNLTVF